MQKNRFFDVLFGACVLAALFLVVPLLPVRGIRAAAPQASVYRILRRIRVGGGTLGILPKSRSRYESTLHLARDTRDDRR